jgi:SAM-dependent methyltransferase
MLKKIVKRAVPQRVLDTVYMYRYYGSVVGRLWGYGDGLQPIQCIVCGVTSRFTAFGRPPRYGARCPSCGCLERHRLLVMLDQREQLFQGKSVLHFAPELILQRRIKKTASRYLSADIEGWRADVQMNIETIDQPSETWDIVVASHVLEHVNDEMAMKEIYRILKAGGKCIAMTPIIEGWGSTYENPAITKPSDRVSHFGQEDHVRYYGRDFKERLERVGFTVREFYATGSECVEYGLLRGEKIFIGSK